MLKRSLVQVTEELRAFASLANRIANSIVPNVSYNEENSVVNLPKESIFDIEHRVTAALSKNQDGARREFFAYLSNLRDSLVELKRTYVANKIDIFTIEQSSFREKMNLLIDNIQATLIQGVIDTNLIRKYKAQLLEFSIYVVSINTHVAALTSIASEIGALPNQPRNQFKHESAQGFSADELSDLFALQMQLLNLSFGEHLNNFFIQIETGSPLIEFSLKDAASDKHFSIDIEPILRLMIEAFQDDDGGKFIKNQKKLFKFFDEREEKEMKQLRKDRKQIGEDHYSKGFTALRAKYQKLRDKGLLLTLDNIRTQVPALPELASTPKRPSRALEGPEIPTEARPD